MSESRPLMGREVGLTRTGGARMCVGTESRLPPSPPPSPPLSTPHSDADACLEAEREADALVTFVENRLAHFRGDQACLADAFSRTLNKRCPETARLLREKFGAPHPDDLLEPLLQGSDESRFVLLPIVDLTVWREYKKHQASLCTADEFSLEYDF